MRLAGGAKNFPYRTKLPARQPKVV